MHGADLMSNGIEINASDLTHSHVIILHAHQATAAAASEAKKRTCGAFSFYD